MFHPSSWDADQKFDNAILHIYDLPQLYTKPSLPALLRALNLLQKTSNNFDGTTTNSSSDHGTYTIDSAQVARYLTSIISSSLNWINPEDAEVIWDLASLRLSERAGRTAAPSLDRSFHINDNLTIKVHEPSLTEDNLGLKTWTSSLLLAKRLPSLIKYIPNGRPRVLELGSGTGLVGLAAAFTWQNRIISVLLTDLPEIVPNLRRNIESNSVSCHNRLTDSDHAELDCCVLDWADEKNQPESAKFPLIVAADPIYSSEHPKLLADTVRKWLDASADSRFIVELPLRDGYSKDRADLRRRLNEFMQIVEQGEERGYDDWEGQDGRPAEVTCWWAVWRLRVYDIA